LIGSPAFREWRENFGSAKDKATAVQNRLSNVRTPNSAADHVSGGRFVNPTGPALQPPSALPRMLLEQRADWPSRIDQPVKNPPERGDTSATVTFVGHSTFLIQTASGHILTDPMYSRRAGPWNILGPRRVRRPAVPFDALPPISIVLLSHNHYDHCDLPTLGRLARRFDPLVIAPLGNAGLVRSAGIRRVEELDWWQPATSAPLPVTLTPAHHFSARGPFDRNRALWGGFTLDVASRRIYFAGDTAYTPLFRDVRRHIGAIDLALLPIGAYEPRWFMSAVHMNPAEAVQAHLDLEARQSVAMHYGTFQLTTEGIDEPLRALAEARDARNVDASSFRALEFGGSLWL
jgi:L-ascorbate metabolism protein UlaG (beta-lactamase superfamily)